MNAQDLTALLFIAIWAVALLGPTFTTYSDHRED